MFSFIIEASVIESSGNANNMSWSNCIIANEDSTHHWWN